MDRRHRTARQIALGALLTIVVSAVVAPGAVAAKEPNGNASCIGLEQASISPPGSSDELPGGARQFVGEVKAIASALGVAPGAVFSFIAKLHAGSHADCDEALEG